VCVAAGNKLKSGNCMPEQREQLRMLNAPQTNNSMHASAVRAVFGLLLPVLSFITDHTHQYLYLSLLWSSTSSFFQVNLKIIRRNVTSRKNKDVQLQNSNLEFGIMSISYYRTSVQNLAQKFSGVTFLVLGHFLSRTL